MTAPNRPLSPHLSIYRPQLTTFLSITHRMTGVALAVGTLLLAWWLGAAAYGPEAYARAQGFLGSILGRLLLLGWTFALFFHLCNGIRHLAWDAGKNFEIKKIYSTGYMVLIAAIALTAIAWAVGLTR
ncbi:MAG: succinate dehydrogenase, cytochrome b556 subunit [Rhodospirillales bacterium]|nr:succinate dehydrogenase, cytochrome b556 subunit [Rhodospirillales bacterium]